MFASRSAAFLLLSSIAHAQFPSLPDDVIVIDSELTPEVKLSYKQTDLCETTPGVRSFAGYVHLPSSALSDMEFDFPLNTFFLYFEARNNSENAPLVIYLAGGPGESSAFTAMNSEGGPCYVNLDGNSTTLNPWSLNNHANMLYIDQPVGAGFSYTTLVNATYSLANNEIVPLSEYDGDIPESNEAFGQGTYTDPTVYATTNTSVSTALALWHFAEHWLSEFPEYTSSNKKIGVWANSAGGVWAPETAALFDQKLKASNTNSPLSEWSVDNLGITNGMIDLLEELPFWASFPYNNTYRPLISEEMFASAEGNFTKEDGCRDLILQCRAAALEGDPEDFGTNEDVNTLCTGATGLCLQEVGFTVLNAQRSPFDIAVSTEDTEGSDPCPFYLPVHTFLNQEWTQKALGVPLNFTYISEAVLRSFTLSEKEVPPKGTGDFVRTTKANLEYALQNDIKVALVYGDRDSRCPWTGGEHTSLVANHSGQAQFAAAGYEFIDTNGTYQGGVVRQHDKFSFSRVFMAGHAVNAYQPETVEKIFQRTLAGQDVATGSRLVDRRYSTQGPSSSLGMFNGTLEEAPPTCMVLGAFQSENPWAPILALMGDGQDDEDQSGTDSGDSSGNSTGGNSSGDNSSSGGGGGGDGDGDGEPSMSVRTEPAVVLALLLSGAAAISHMI